MKSDKMTYEEIDENTVFISRAGRDSKVSEAQFPKLELEE